MTDCHALNAWMWVVIEDGPQYGPAHQRVTPVHHSKSLCPTAPVGCVPHQHGAVQPPNPPRERERGAMMPPTVQGCRHRTPVRFGRDTPNNHCRVSLRTRTSDQGGRNEEESWLCPARRTITTTTRPAVPSSRGCGREELCVNLTLFQAELTRKLVVPLAQSLGILRGGCDPLSTPLLLGRQRLRLHAKVNAWVVALLFNLGLLQVDADVGVAKQLPLENVVSLTNTVWATHDVQVVQKSEQISTFFHLICISIQLCVLCQTEQQRYERVPLLAPCTWRMSWTSPTSSSQMEFDGWPWKVLTNGDTFPPSSIPINPCNMAFLDTRSKAPMPSTEMIVVFASPSVKCSRRCATHSQPARAARACCRGAVAASTCLAICLATVLAMSRRRKSPTTMAPTPPSGLRNAVMRAIQITSSIPSGTSLRVMM